MAKIAAIVTISRSVSGYSVFMCKTKSERDDVANLLSNILRASIHDLGNGSLVLITRGVD